MMFWYPTGYCSLCLPSVAKNPTWKRVRSKKGSPSNDSSSGYLKPTNNPNIHQEVNKLTSCRVFPNSARKKKKTTNTIWMNLQLCWTQKVRCRAMYVIRFFLFEILEKTNLIYSDKAGQWLPGLQRMGDWIGRSTINFVGWWKCKKFFWNW